MPLPLLNQIYIVCAAIGSLFLIICAVMGAHHGGSGGAHNGHVGATGHTGLGHSGSGHAGGHPQLGHTGSSSSSIGETDGVGHIAIGHGDIGHAAIGAHSGTVGGAHDLGQAAQLQARSGPFHAPTREEEAAGPIEAILGFLNPTIITTFLAFFGLTGFFFISSFPALGPLTLAPAFLGGLISIKIVTNIMNVFLLQTFNSSAATEHDLIGHMAEVSVPISNGHTGEVTYIVSSKRLTAPARAKNPTEDLKRGTKVIICDHLEKYVVVDQWTDNFVDPAFDEETLTTEEKLAKIREREAQYE